MGRPRDGLTNRLLGCRIDESISIDLTPTTPRMFEESITEQKGICPLFRFPLIKGSGPQFDRPMMMMMM